MISMNLLLDYLVENNVDRDSTFPPEIWVACDGSLCMSSNVYESFYPKFNSESLHTHPDIYCFLKTLNDIPSDT